MPGGGCGRISRERPACATVRRPWRGQQQDAGDHLLVLRSPGSDAARGRWGWHDDERTDDRVAGDGRDHRRATVPPMTAAATENSRMLPATVVQRHRVCEVEASRIPPKAPKAEQSVKASDLHVDHVDATSPGRLGVAPGGVQVPPPGRLVQGQAAHDHQRDREDRSPRQTRDHQVGVVVPVLVGEDRDDDPDRRDDPAPGQHRRERVVRQAGTRSGHRLPQRGGQVNRHRPRA